MMAPVPLAQIGALQTGLKAFLDKVEQTLEGKVFQAALPMLGNQLGSAFGRGEQALTAFGSFEQAVLGALGKITTAMTTTQLQTAIDTAIAQLHLPGDPGSVTVTDLNQTLTVSFADSFTEQLAAQLDGSFGLPGLGFKPGLGSAQGLGVSTTGTAQTTLGYGPQRDRLSHADRRLFVERRPVAGAGRDRAQLRRRRLAWLHQLPCPGRGVEA